MMKKPLYVVGALLALLLFCAYFLYQSPNDEVLDFYMEYVEACIEDRIAATKEYVHYEDPAQLERETADANCPLLKTDILSIEKLSDDLWAIRIYYENLYVPDGDTTYHFVGAIDGEYKVMKNIWNIPPTLSQNLDLESYQPTGDFISPDEIIEEDNQK